ncbi:MAG: glycosyltransferase family 39 protein, partial [Desulfobacteraceae bacterium]|nr:glycosyltransferase family 39 protein [Desulfobacteraceae bacterium]
MKNWLLQNLPLSIVKEISPKKKKPIFIFFSLILIVIAGFYIRCESVLNTEVINPLRADAGQYFMYAYNLRHKHTYFHQVGNPKDLESPVKPDAVRSPGYPLFLALFVDGLPNNRMINWILFSQVLISTLTILFTFLLFEKIFSPIWSLGIALLVAISPHLIVSNSYILTETFFCFLLVAFGFLFGLFAKKPSLWLGLVVGVAMGIAALVRPSLQFFPIILAFFLIFHYGWKRGKRYSGVMLMGFALAFLPWIGRNMATLGTATDNRLMVNFLYHG